MEVNVDRDFFSDSPASAVRAVFKSWTLTACKAWLEWDIGLELVEEEETSKLFPASHSGRDVRDALVNACAKQGISILYGASLERLERSPVQHCHPPSSTNTSQDSAGYDFQTQPQPQTSSPWLCHLADGSTHTADRLVLATGGLSFPAVGTDGTGHRILKQLGVTLVDTYPALTPLTGVHPGKAQLAGLSLYSVGVSVKRPGAKKPHSAHRTGMLFTHKGFSGPAILDVSHMVLLPILKGGERPTLSVNWTGQTDEEWDKLLQCGGSAYVSTLLRKQGLRERLADGLCEEMGLQTRRLSELRKDERQELVHRLTAYPLQYTGHEGYKKAEVTGGGVPLTQVCTRTLELKALPGVYVAGELLDVFGRIGGFNFLWAWISGRLAGRSAALAALSTVDHASDVIAKRRES